MEGWLERSVAYYAPVGADGSLESQFSVKDFRRHVVGIINVEGIVISTAVVAHGCKGAFLNAFLPGKIVILLVVSGIDQPTATATQVGPASWPVLKVYEYLSGTHMVSLCPLDQGGRHVCGQFRGFGEAAHVPAPPGLGDDIYLGSQEHVETYGTIFLGHYLSETAHHFRIPSGCDAHLALTVGYMGEILGTADVTSKLGAVPGVGGEHDRYAQTGSLGNLLHAIGPGREFFRGSDTVV